MLNIAFAMKGGSIFFRAEFRSARMEYILDEILGRRLGLDFFMAGKDEPLPEDAITIHYGLPGNGQPEFPDSGILRESLITPMTFKPGFTDYFLHTNQGKIRNDLFGSAFFLLSLYREQSMQVEADPHGRFPEQVLFHENISQKPQVEYWVAQLRMELEKLGISCNKNPAELDFSIDWDNPTAFLHKGLFRNSASLLFEILQGNLSAASRRLRVLRGKEKDPYDHLGSTIPPEVLQQRRIFFWVGDYGKHDKGLSYRNSWYREQIRELSKIMIPGLHPSYASFLKPDQMLKEKKRLEEILDQPVTASRFHYLRFRLPESYRMLEECGISEDFSMGYSAFPGFRAGTALPFYFFDLERNQKSNLLIHPFSLMDSSAAYRGKTRDSFLKEAEFQFKTGEDSGYPVHAIFHNEHPSREGWKNAIGNYLMLKSE